MPVGTRNEGFAPFVGLHRRGSVYRQGSSYAHVYSAVIPLILAVIVHLQPWGNWPAPILNLAVRDLIALVFLWGGCCSLLVYYLRNKFGLLVLIDPDHRTLQMIIRKLSIEKGASMSIAKKEHVESIPWNRIVAVQLCHETAPNRENYQLNLVWQTPGAEIRRHCLATHGSKRFMTALGKRYESLFGFKLMDHTV